MDDIGSVKPDDYIGTVKYRFNVPALSFASYQAVSTMNVRYLYRGNRLRNVITAIFTGAILGTIPMILKLCGVNLFASIWLDTDDDWDMTFFTVEVLVILLYAVIFGFLAFCLLVRRRAKKVQKKLYADSSFIQSGYQLTLGDAGVSCLSPNMMSAIKWQELGCVKRSKGTIYILLRAGGFLWLPEDLDGCDVDAVYDFINSKVVVQ